MVTAQCSCPGCALARADIRSLLRKAEKAHRRGDTDCIAELHAEIQTRKTYLAGCLWVRA